MAAGKIDGVKAQIRWAYYVAADIHGFTVVRKNDGGRVTWSVRATVVLHDKFKMAQRPLIFVAPFLKGRVAWPILDFRLVDGALTANLGPIEEKF